MQSGEAVVKIFANFGPFKVNVVRDQRTVIHGQRARREFPHFSRVVFRHGAITKWNKHTVGHKFQMRDGTFRVPEKREKRVSINSSRSSSKT